MNLKNNTMAELELTPQMEKDYLEDPNHCPFCKSGNLTADRLEPGDYDATRNVKCLDCKAEWVETFTMTSIDNAERDE